MSQSGYNEKILRKALEGIIAILGPSGKNAVISELKSRCDYDQEYLETKVVMDCLVHLFGPDSAGLLLEVVNKVECKLEARIIQLENSQHQGTNISANAS